MDVRQRCEKYIKAARIAASGNSAARGRIDTVDRPRQFSTQEMI